jgi:hypothetical protein
MALQTRLMTPDAITYLRWIYDDNTQMVQRIEWGNTSTDLLFRAKVVNPVGKVLVDTGNLLPGVTGAVNIPPPDRFSWEDERITVQSASGRMP